MLGNIRGKSPTLFLLGSVRGLVHHHHDACKWILLQIEGTRAGHGALYYQAYWAALSTTDYGAEFVVELSSQHLQKKFDWPQPLPRLDDFYDATRHLSLLGSHASGIHTCLIQLDACDQQEETRGRAWSELTIGAVGL